MAHALVEVHFDYVAPVRHEGHGLLCLLLGHVSVIEVTNRTDDRIFPDLRSVGRVPTKVVAAESSGRLG
jgi:hypothetical protein